MLVANTKTAALEGLRALPKSSWCKVLSGLGVKGARQKCWPVMMANSDLQGCSQQCFSSCWEYVRGIGGLRKQSVGERSNVAAFA